MTNLSYHALIDSLRSSGFVRIWAPVVILAVLLAGAQFHTIQESFGTYYAHHVQAADDFLDGTPHWRAHQSRVLGPYMVRGMEVITGWDFDTCYQVVTFLLLFSFFLVLMLSARSIFKNELVALGIAMSAGFLNAFLMQGEWLYLWDYINLITFTVVSWAIISRKPLWSIIAIIVVEIFNHDLALVMAGWLFLDALLVVKGRGLNIPQVSLSPRIRQALLAVAIIIAGYFIMDSLRDWLLVRESAGVHGIAIAEQWGVRVYRFGDLASVFPFNLELMGDSFLMNSQADLWAERLGTSNLIIFNPLILGIPIVCLWAIISRDTETSRTGILFLILWASVFGTSPIYETRIWLPFVPFLSLIIPLICLGRKRVGLDSKIVPNEITETTGEI